MSDHIVKQNSIRCGMTRAGMRTQKRRSFPWGVVLLPLLIAGMYLIYRYLL